MVGSFQYTLFRLQERVVGKGRGVPQVRVIPSPADPGEVNHPAAPGLLAPRHHRRFRPTPAACGSARGRHDRRSRCRCRARRPSPAGVAVRGRVDPDARHSTANLSLGALQVNPFASGYRVTVELPESGGLLPNQDVSLRGVRVGRVDRLDITPSGVDAVVNVKSSVPIPKSSAVRVSGLSPAGEQYIDFVAQSNDGPYLGDGSHRRPGPGHGAGEPGRSARPCRRRTGPGRHGQAGHHQARVEPQRGGPAKLADIIDGGTFLLSTLDSVLPETTSVLRKSRPCSRWSLTRTLESTLRQTISGRALSGSAGCGMAIAGSPIRRRARCRCR